MSAIFYRFKSQRQDSRLAIDGTGISVFDLKKEIIIANQMGDGKEFDLGLYDSNGEGAFPFALLLREGRRGTDLHALASLCRLIRVHGRLVHHSPFDLGRCPPSPSGQAGKRDSGHVRCRHERERDPGEHRTGSHAAAKRSTWGDAELDDQAVRREGGRGSS